MADVSSGNESTASQIDSIDHDSSLHNPFESNANLRSSTPDPNLNVTKSLELTKILKGFIGTDSLTQEHPMEAAEEEKEEEEKEEMMEEDTTKVGGQVQGLDTR